MIHIDVYRVQGTWPGTSPKFIPRHFWCRTWQAEWEGCQRAARAWTEAGVYRKALRAIRRGTAQ